MSVELKYLTLVSTFTGLIWIPYILNEIMVRGLLGAVGYPDNPKPLAPWAQRMKAAHYNAVENLVVFAALVLAAQALNATSEATATAAVVYFWARIVHWAVYTLRVPWLRTIAFVVGFACQMTLAWQILSKAS